MKFQDGSAGMERVLTYLHTQQSKNGTRPMSFRAIGRATGISHTHVSNIIKHALCRGVLKLNPKGYALQRIPTDTNFQGLRWLHVLECSWKEPINWDGSDETQGAWIPIDLFGLPPRAECYLVRILKNEPYTGGYPPHLGRGCTVIARPLKDPSDAKLEQWCLVTYGRRVCSMYRVGGDIFSQPRGPDRPSLEVPLRRVSHAAVIETLIQKRKRKQNQAHRIIADVMGMSVSSEKFDPEVEGLTTVTVNIEILKRRLGVPRHLDLTEGMDPASSVAHVVPVFRKKKRIERGRLSDWW